MPFTVVIKVSREFRAASSPERTFALLSDVPVSASHFPDVERIDDLGGNAFHWTMERIAIGEHTLQQTVYASLYESDASSMTVRWSPILGVGNALVEGWWKLEPAASGTMVRFYTKGELVVEMPGFLQFFLSPLIELAFTQKIDRYISNLRGTLG